mmetsp:Transcript_142841/g.456214  ORF Transcript_142841/g.456214 Transcript_142841/m.456214 type:complete len:633 (-) Transcript_142841:54-1952(-)
MAAAPAPRLLGNLSNLVAVPLPEEDGPPSPVKRTSSSRVCCRVESSKAAASVPGSAYRSLHRAFSRKLPCQGVSEEQRCVEIWLAGEWKKLGTSECEEISRREAAGETSFKLSSRGHVYRIDLGQMTQADILTGRSRSMRFVDVHAAGCSARGFDVFRKTFHDYAGAEGPMTQDKLMGAWPSQTGRKDDALVRATVKAMLQEMSLRQQQDGINLLEWNHYWALDRDSPSFQAAADVNKQMAKSLREDSQVLGRLQMHFETAMSESSSSSGGLTSQGLVKVCERLVRSPQDVLEKRWASQVLEKHEQGEVILDDDAEFNYFDFLNVMLGRQRFKVSLWLYDITEGMANRWAWLVLGQQFEGIWHTGVVVEYPGRHAEFWFGGNLFISTPGATPFGSPSKKVHLGYTYKTREEVRSHMARHLASEFTRARYDVMTRNCNHFSDRLCSFLLNEHVPDEVMSQPQRVMSSLAAQAVRPFLNRWLGGFGGGAPDAPSEAPGSAARPDVSKKADKMRLSDEMQPGALVEFSTVEGGRPMVGEITDLAPDGCTVRWLDVWARGAASWSVPAALVLRVLVPAPSGFLAELNQPGVREDTCIANAAATGCSWPPLPYLLGQRPPNRGKEFVHPHKRSAQRI